MAGVTAMDQEAPSLLLRGLRRFEHLDAILEGFDFDVHCTQRGGRASLAHLDGRCPLVKLDRQVRLNLFELIANPLLVVFG